MTDKEKIREEVERLFKKNRERSSREDYAAVEQLRNVLSFIDSLQDEPVSEDLDKEMDIYLASVFSEDMDGGEPRFTTWFKALRKTAIHFANWQKEQFEKNRLAACDKQTPEEAQCEMDFIMSIIEKEHRQPTFDDAIKYGMKVQKELMMKAAVVIETSMMEDDCDDLTPVIGDMRNKGFKFGDRVKLIIIKEKQ